MVAKCKQPFDCLPDEIIAQIMANSPSFEVFSVLKNTCKRFKGLSDDFLVLRRISKEVVVQSLWQEKKNKPISYLKRCADAGNPNAQYLMGMVITISLNFI
ncbi:hypothetical protein AMTR_s00072p00097200 [Amborella trichopoda]|uniref:F-box domain-containing protein n=1 Tax=Amborella trichopoda TaxID=13333 RepID=W1NRC9_AMBTC|nr:hypothetical protein AMTR_s00072p00097200 [Amborella trichopoda]